MTVLLVLLTFAVFMTVDYVTSRKRHSALAQVPAPDAATEQPALSIYELPEELAYHAGHTWMKRERKNVNRVGVDALAAALSAGCDEIELPKPGTWIRQGQRCVGISRQGVRVEIVSPVEGEVVEVNPEAAAAPGLLNTDPYGRGWLFTVFSPDEESVTRNLLPRALWNTWMRDSVERLFQFQPALAGVTAADGGELAPRLGEAFEPAQWQRAAREIFLS